MCYLNYDCLIGVSVNVLFDENSFEWRCYKVIVGLLVVSVVMLLFIVY